MELSLYWLCDCVYWCPVLLILQLITDDLIEIIEAYFYFLFQLLSCCGTRLSTTLDEVIVYPIPAVLYLVKNLLQVESDSCLFSVSTGSFSSCLICDFVFFHFLWQYYIFAYVDAPGYQILKNLNIISTGVLYRIILKKKYFFSSCMLWWKEYCL